MPVMSASALRKQIASRETGPLYLLVGDDELEKSAVASEFADVVEEDFRPFNYDRLYGGETRIDALFDAANTMPMMASRRVIVVLEAEKLLTPKRESKAADEDQERLLEFLSAPPPHATIVFVCGALDQRRKVVKLLLKEAQIVDCGTIENDAEAARWVLARAAREGVTLDGAAVRTLVARAGIDIGRLRSGLERVMLYAMGQKAISADDVREAVPAGPESQADFGIANAIGRGDAREALKELKLALEGGAAPYFVLGQVRFAAEKLPASRLRAGVEAVFRTDLALKSSGGDPRMLLEWLVVELCGDSRAAGTAVRRPQSFRPR
jgi:DNA polymerase-3 subunit delta